MLHTMTYLRAEAVRWADDHFPGFVEIKFQQADGSTASLIEKVPVVQAPGIAGETELTCDATYPITLELGCDLMGIDPDRRVATIELYWGNGIFEVPVDLLGDLPAT
ncbi:hypothetical protein AB0N05_15865 [Nocardia sp. NPDC051030]|uniref:hypothetical protein n=1 Tax=Nocardia sp. NPDC051030 TaxID=3155162 RepID=UPI003447C5F3